MESNLNHELQKRSANDARIINVGSRKSQLALIQTNQVIEKLKEFYSNNPDRWEQLENCHMGLKPHSEPIFKVVSMNTTGDKILDKPLPTIGTKSLFTRELEIELLENRVDFVVHSLKDLPTTFPDGLTIGAVMERDDPDDTVVLKRSLRSKINPLDLLLGRGANYEGMHDFKIGTSSKRRIAMVRRCNPNLKCIDIRGNLNTRLSKLDNDSGEYAAIILARAGLDRMGWSDRASCQLEPNNDPSLSDWSYAVGQGAIAVECRSEDEYILDFLSPIVNLKTTYEVIAERSLMKKLEAGCSVPLGVRSIWSSAEEKNILKLESIVLSVDGQNVVKAEGSLILSSSKTAHNAMGGSRLESLTTGINVSRLVPTYAHVTENMISCAELGIEIANKMIGLGCLKLLT